MMKHELEQLRVSFDEFLNIPFPGDSEHETLSDIHAGLAEYDGYIAGHISSIIAGAKVLPRELQIDNRLRERLYELAALEKGEVKLNAKTYLEYLDKLEELVGLARKVVKK